MKRNMTLFVVLCFLALALTGIAAAQAPAKVAGSWDMTMQTARGTSNQTLTIQQDGAKITGTLKGQRGESPLEGTVAGNTLNFTVKRQTQNGEMTVAYTGTVEADALKGTVMMGQNNVEWTAKRSQAAQ